MKKKVITITKIIILIISLTNNILFAQQIEVSGKNYKLTKIAINHFLTQKYEEKIIAKEIRDTVCKNLSDSGIFSIVAENNFIEQNKGSEFIPFFEAWKKINATILVNGSLTKNRKNNYTIVISIWDNILAKKILHRKITFSEKSIQKTSHIISDHIYQEIIGEKGYFDSKILYVAEKVIENKIFTRIAMMNQDGKEHKYLTNGKFISISPKISPDKENIAYVDFRAGISKIFLRNLYSGQENLLTNMKGSIFSPRFSRNGKKILFSLAKKGATNIFKFDINTKKISVLTRNIYINTSPQFSPDDKKIIFTSNRLGTAKIYTMNEEGKNVVKITEKPGSHLEPKWSPDGKYISYINLRRKLGYYINIINTKTGEETTVVKSDVIHGYCWCPNSKYILFSEAIGNKEEEKKTIYKLQKINIFNKHKTTINTPYSASDPIWY